MNTAPPICLKFSEEVPHRVRARISYAMRVFAAVYNHPVVDEASGAICCVYGACSNLSHAPRAVHIPARYRLKPAETCPPDLVKHSYADEEFHLFHGVEEATGSPDWLGEIFEWITCSHEMSSLRRDSVGRIPYSETVFSRQGISPRRPHALMLMSWLENVLQNGGAREALPK